MLPKLFPVSPHLPQPLHSRRPSLPHRLPPPLCLIYNSPLCLLSGQMTSLDAFGLFLFEDGEGAPDDADPKELGEEGEGGEGEEEVEGEGVGDGGR
jgi:hypothetical protein